MIDTSTAEVRPHYCHPPRLQLETVDKAGQPIDFRDVYNDDGIERFVRWTYPVGTRFTCDDCGRVWVATYVHPYVGARVAYSERVEWSPETRRQRRQRLGLRWWQREPR